jgi:subtilisin-like proprotein convertase family protein
MFVRMKLLRVLIITLAVGARIISHAETFSFSNLNRPIPDGQGAGVADFETTSSTNHQISAVQVSLNISGNFNGDLYCYLQHGTAVSVLLNRPGRSASNPDGYADSGFLITLSDSASNGDIHNYQNTVTLGSPLTGLWQPDGRAIDPGSVLDTDPRTAMLNSFNGLDANGNWTLFLADLSAGGLSTLNSWQLVVNPLPEPSPGCLVILGALLGLVRRRIRHEG